MAVRDAKMKNPQALPFNSLQCCHREKHEERSAWQDKMYFNRGTSK